MSDTKKETIVTTVKPIANIEEDEFEEFPVETW
jgi:hypothetical protein